MTLYGTTIGILLTAVFVVMFLPVENLAKRLIEVDLPRTHVAALMVLVGVSVLIYKTNVAGLIYLVLTFVTLWAFSFGFLSDRKFIYLLALVFLGLSPVFLILNLSSTAELSATLSYLCLVLGVLKDIFYEKIVEE